MFTTLITDCYDDNARVRQTSRIASLITTDVSLLGVDSDLAAGMQLIDVLDATEGRPGIILVNIAPRGGHTTKWENGTPFGYFWHHDTLVISSVDGLALAAAKKLGLVSEVQLLDTHTTAEVLLREGLISAEAAAHMPVTQFRSFDFTPRAGVFLFNGGQLPSEPYGLENISDLPPAIWHIDSFGNCKTTLLPEDITTDATETRFGTFPYTVQLRNLPDTTTSLIRGSSGLGTTRFLELMTQRRNFATAHNAKIGDNIFTAENHAVRATA